MVWAYLSIYENGGKQEMNLSQYFKSIIDEDKCAVVICNRKVAAWFADSADHNRIYTFHNEKENRDVYMVALRDEDGTLIGYYEKHEYRNAEESGLYQFD